MKSLLSLFAIVLLSLGATACGSAEKSGDAKSSSAPSSTTTDSTTDASSTAQAPVVSKADKDNDNDIDAPDDDTGNEDSITDFGPPATAAETRVITALVKRYYKVAAAGNGATACAMLYSTISESVPEDYGMSPPGPAYAKGTTCQQVMTRSFQHFHNELTQELARIKIVRVRVREHQGMVELRFGTMPERYVQVIREGPVWKMESLLDHEVD